MAKSRWEELFEIVQEPQGYAYISDSEEDLSDEEVINRAENALYWHRVTANKLQGFIRRMEKGASHDR